MEKKLQCIALTDYYFKELCQKRKDYLAFILNGICNLDLKESEIEFSDTEERDSCTFKTIHYDIKVISQNVKIDLEAQMKLNSNDKNEYGEYTYDLARAFYYLAVLHSRAYDYKEKGYEKRRSIVVFLFKYDLPGDSIIQEIGMNNRTRKIEYDDMLIYFVSLEKIPYDSKIEVERALKLLSSFDMGPYLDDTSSVIRRAATMLCDYDRSEAAQMARDAEKKDELEKATIRMAGIKEGRAEGINEAQSRLIKTMHEKGMSAEEIARICDFDLSYVLEVLK